jgi:hypothetical protein
MTKKRKTRVVDKNQYLAFFTKAKDFASMMDISLKEGKKYYHNSNANRNNNNKSYGFSVRCLGDLLAKIPVLSLPVHQAGFF